MFSNDITITHPYFNYKVALVPNSLPNQLLLIACAVLLSFRSQNALTQKLVSSNCTVYVMDNIEPFKRPMYYPCMQTFKFEALEKCLNLWNLPHG